MQPTILVTGGAGYIGSHAAFLLAQKGYNVIVLDKLVHGQVFDHPWATLIKGDIGDTQLLDDIFTQNNIDAVMHFAAYINVGESVREPIKYYKNNVIKTLTLLERMLAHNVKRFIFSSSCAVYGVPQELPLREDHPKHPISPYGTSKLMVELALQDLHKTDGLQFVALFVFMVV